MRRGPGEISVSQKWQIVPRPRGEGNVLCRLHASFYTVAASRGTCAMRSSSRFQPHMQRALPPGSSPLRNSASHAHRQQRFPGRHQSIPKDGPTVKGSRRRTVPFSPCFHTITNMPPNLGGTAPQALSPTATRRPRARRPSGPAGRSDRSGFVLQAAETGEFGIFRCAKKNHFYPVCLILYRFKRTIPVDFTHDAEGLSKSRKC